MKQLLCFCLQLMLFALLPPVAWAQVVLEEFGRSAQEGPSSFQRKRKSGFERAQTGWIGHPTFEEARILEKFEEILDGEDGVDMSMSFMSLNPTSSPTSANSISPSYVPSDAPSLAPTKSMSVDSTSPSSVPSDNPSLAPTEESTIENTLESTTHNSEQGTPEGSPEGSPQGSSESSNESSPEIPPSQSPEPTNGSTTTPTSIPDAGTVHPESPSQSPVPPAFDCHGNGGVRLGTASDVGNTTEIFLAIGYKAESTANLSDVYVDDLESQLLETAVLAALGCSLRRRLVGQSRHLLETMVVDSCEPSLEVTESCTILETELRFYLNGIVDADEAAYASYSAVEDHMTNDKYIGVIPTIVRLEYLSPLPLPVPPELTDPTSESSDPPIAISPQANEEAALSAWTIGACAATVVGGAISLLAWERNRRSRHHRHIQILEDSSLVADSRNPVSI